MLLQCTIVCGNAAQLYTSCLINYKEFRKNIAIYTLLQLLQKLQK